MLYAHADQAFCNGHGMFGNELLEGDEKAGLDGNAARDCGVTVGGQRSRRKREAEGAYSIKDLPVSR